MPLIVDSSRRASHALALSHNREIDLKAVSTSSFSEALRWRSIPRAHLSKGFLVQGVSGGLADVRAKLRIALESRPDAIMLSQTEWRLNHAIADSSGSL